MRLLRRFGYMPPWKLTRFGFRFPFQWGGDEFHNIEVQLVCPLGWFSFAFGQDFQTSTEHLWAAQKVGDEVTYVGLYVPGCSTCDEIMEDLMDYYKVDCESMRQVPGDDD